MFVLDLLQAHREQATLRRQARGRLEAHQRQRFRTLAAYCARHSAYYRQVMADRRIDPAAAEVEQFPILDKATMVANFDAIATDPAVRHSRVVDFVAENRDPASLLDGRLQVINTSGTSGHMGYFVFSGADWAYGLSPALAMHAFRPQRRRLAFYGMTRGHYAGVCMAMTGNRGLMRAAYRSKAFDLLNPVEETLPVIDRFQPTIIVAYPTALLALAEAQRAGTINIAPEVLQCSGETLLPQHRAAIERAFGQRLHNVYCSGENLIMGHCGDGSGTMVLQEQNFVFEIEPSHLLVTNLYNRTLPLIRYRVNDRLEPAAAPRGDHQPFRRVSETIGRTEDSDLVFSCPGGRQERLTSYAFECFAPKYVERFQFRLSDRACELDLVPEAGRPQANVLDAVVDAEERLRSLFAARRLDHLAIKVRLVERIQPDRRTGKVRVVTKEGEAASRPANLPQAPLPLAS
jgi:phenylacetate-coenzyme A ligase PaaK-like adenylate-forming protein